MVCTGFQVSVCVVFVFDVLYVSSECSILGCGLFFFQAEDGIRDLVRSRGLGDVYKRQDVGRLAANQAYEQAGLGPRDMDVAEVHEASSMGEIIQVENLGFAYLGEGGVAAERGEFSLGGRLPVNPSGGSESKGNPLGATGIGQLYELTTQLRGEAGARQVPRARHAIQQNGGGLQGIEDAAVAIHILSRACA